MSFALGFGLGVGVGMVLGAFLGIAGVVALLGAAWRSGL